jgi:hypothetical protein
MMNDVSANKISFCFVGLLSSREKIPTKSAPRFHFVFAPRNFRMMGGEYLSASRALISGSNRTAATLKPPR